MELIGKFKKIQEKISQKGNYYKLITFLNKENNKIYNIQLFKKNNEDLYNEINSYLKKNNKIFKIEVETWNNILILISIKEEYDEEETRNSVEAKVLSGLIKFYNEPELIPKFKKILYSKYFKNKTHIKILGEILSNDGKVILENYIDFNYLDIDKDTFVKYINKLLEIYQEEKKELLKEKILNNEDINIEELNEDNIFLTLDEIKAKNVLYDNSDFLFKYKNKKTLGCPTGFNELDRVIDGIFGLVGLTGVPGMGKTSMALQIAEHNIFNEENDVLYISLEVSADLLISKLAAFRSKIIMKKSLKNFLEYEEALKFYDTIEEILEKDNFYIIDKKINLTFEMLENIIYDLKKKNEKECNNKDILVVLDYLNIFNEPSLNSIKDKNEKMAVIIQRFIDIKNKTKANFLIILAKNKQGYKSAEMASIKGDNNLEYGLETIVSLEDPKNIDINEDIEALDFNVIAVILKNRWGENFRKIPFKFEGKINRFQEVKI